MNTDESWYMDLAISNGHNLEKRLMERMEDLGPLFEDMRFERGTSAYDLIRCESMSQDGGEWFEDEVQRPPEIECFTYLWFHPKVEELDDCAGYFDAMNQEICIPPESVEDDRVLLHEMIHLHEFVINEQPMYFHDMLLWALYKHVRERLPKLDEIISDHAHLLTGSSLYAQGGLHDILFLLKSFDLDMRRGYPLGTVFGYGRNNEFKDYGYV